MSKKKQKKINFFLKKSFFHFLTENKKNKCHQRKEKNFEIIY